MWGGHTYPCQPNPEKSGCRSLGLRLPEIEWSFRLHILHIFHYPCQYLGLPAITGGFAWAGGDWGLVTLMISMRTCAEFGGWGSVGWNFAIQRAGTFLRCLNLIQMRQVWVGFFFPTQLGHGPLPIRPAWLTAARQQTSPENHAGPLAPQARTMSETLLQSLGVTFLSGRGVKGLARQGRPASCQAVVH